jgi:hypothetical protein
MPTLTHLVSISRRVSWARPRARNPGNRLLTTKLISSGATQATWTLLTSAEKFPKLSRIAKLRLTLSHSNASEERVCSMVQKKKNQKKASFRPNIDPEGTLSSLLVFKLANPRSSTSRAWVHYVTDIFSRAPFTLNLIVHLKSSFWSSNKLDVDNSEIHIICCMCLWSTIDD